MSFVLTKMGRNDSSTFLFRFDFMSQDRNRLEQLSNKLTSKLKTIEFLNAARPPLYMLVLHEKACHSAESLIQRVHELDELAKSFGIDGVDDVGASTSREEDE